MYSKHLRWLLLLLLASGGAVVVLVLSSGAGPATPTAAAGAVPVSSGAIGALGRIEPGDGIVRVAARSLTGQATIVGKLLVREGAEVQTGQILAELDSTEQLHATYLLGQARVEVARRLVAQVQTGAKASEMASQKADIERLELELENARKERDRQQRLHEQRVIAEAFVDDANLRVETLGRLLQQAQERLTSLSEVRPVDVALAKAELEAAIREMERARAEYAASLVRSPLDGRVITIHAWPGEEVGPGGLLELARTDQMYVVAEIAESDMARVRAGQRATISGHGLPGTLQGTVETVGLKVMQNSVKPIDPATFSDARVVETRIRLDDSERVAHLIHLRVNVVVEAAPVNPATPDGR